MNEDDNQNLKLARYQQMVRRIWRDGEEPLRPGSLTLRGIFICTNGLAGEVGEVLEPIKKAVRKCAEANDVMEQQAMLDEQLDKLDRLELGNELGDVLYYLTRLGQRWGITLQDMMRLNTEKLEKRYGSR